MVDILIHKTKKSFEIHANGHAQYAEHGKDIVCAAVSILLYTLLEAIDPKDMERDMIVVLQPGSTFISMTPKTEKRDSVIGVLSFVETGFKLLEKNFPKNVCFRGGVG